MVLVALLSTLFFVVGMLGYIAAPWVIAPYLPDWMQRKLARFYLRQSQFASQRTLLVDRRHAGMDLCPSIFDLEKGDGEMVKLDGEPRHFEDTGSKVRYLANKPFGLALEKSSCIVDPILAAIGEKQDELLTNGKFWVDVDTEMTENQQKYVDHVKIPRTPYCVDLDNALSIVGGGLDPSAVSVTWEYGKKSQDPFKGKPVFELFTMVGIFIGVLGVIWLAFSFADGGGSSGGSSGDPIPIMIRSMGWWL